jgi:DNA-binding NarL/FixJ family response regulator
MIRVVLADDHPVVRTGYRRLLEQAGDMTVVGEAGDGDSAYAQFVAKAPDVLAADVSMPGGGGLELLRRVRLRASAARVLLFSMHDSALFVRRAFAAGARGFLTKAGSPAALVDAVRALRRGERYLSPELPRAWMQAPAGPQAESEPLAALSAREFDILRLLAQGCSTAECAQALHLSAKTVANHQSAIKDKLGVATVAALVHLALRHRLIEPR